MIWLFARICGNYPVFATMIVVALFDFGIQSYQRLPIERVHVIDLSVAVIPGFSGVPLIVLSSKSIRNMRRTSIEIKKR